MNVTISSNNSIPRIRLLPISWCYLRLGLHIHRCNDRSMGRRHETAQEEMTTGRPPRTTGQARHFLHRCAVDRYELDVRQTAEVSVTGY